MDISIATLDPGHAEYLTSNGVVLRPVTATAAGGLMPPKTASPTDPDFLRCCAWEISEHHPAAQYIPPANHVGLAMVHPGQGFVYWRILHDWVEETIRQRGGDTWDGCRPVVRLYDVSYIHFTGLNAHRIQDENILSGLTGQLF